MGSGTGTRCDEVGRTTGHTFSADWAVVQGRTFESLGASRRRVRWVL